MSRLALRAEERRWRRGDALAVAGALLLGAVLAWIVLTVQSLNDDLRTANAARDALARQVQDMGGKPVAGKPGSRGEVGQPGERGPRGERGPQGPAGDDGADGKAGKAGSAGKAGAAGEAGQPGSDGVPGQQGPQGEPGPAGPQGPAGEQGPPGADGRDGTDGRDGQTCPDGYSLQAPSWDPDVLVCRRSGAPQQPSGDSSLSTPAALVPDRRRL